MSKKASVRNVDQEKLKKQLIAFGKKKGHVTADELRQLLPPEIVSPSEIGNWEKMLVAEGVHVLSKADVKAVDQATAKVTAPRRSAAKKAADKKKKKDDDESTRTNDPVRMYLRKMGSVSLLTREGEVEIAKRIEQGEKSMLEIALRSPVAVPYALEMYDRVRRSQVRVKDVIQISAPSDNNPNKKKEDQGPVNQEAALENLQKQIDKVRRHQKEIEKIREALANSNLEELEKKAEKFQQQLEDHHRACAEAIRDINLSKKPVDGIVEELTQLVNRVKRAERDLNECERRAGMDLKELRGLFKNVRLSEEEEFKLCRRLGLHPSELHEIEARMRLATKRHPPGRAGDPHGRRRPARASRRPDDGPAARPRRPRPSWSKPTFASSSRSPRSTRTAACSSSTSFKRETSA